VLLLILKTFALALLYLVLVLNKGKYTHDSFLLFYLLILLTHAILPYLAVDFIEKKFSAHRNLPVALWKQIAVFVLAFVLLLLPEAAYIVYQADAFLLEHRFMYYINWVSSLFLLTAVQYANASTKKEYVKACFGLLFFSIFALHAQAFWLWIVIQIIAAILLFISGYFSYEVPAEET
jgi:hypothetical protein